MKNLFKIVLSYLLISFNTYVLAVENKNNALLKVGVLAPFSAEFKDLGETVLYSVNLALNDINDKSIVARNFTIENNKIFFESDISSIDKVLKALQDKNINEAALERLRDEEVRLQNALVNISLPTFGICQGCNNEINFDRLEALPGSTLCTDCAQ